MKSWMWKINVPNFSYKTTKITGNSCSGNQFWSVNLGFYLHVLLLSRMLAKVMSMQLWLTTLNSERISPLTCCSARAKARVQSPQFHMPITLSDPLELHTLDEKRHEISPNLSLVSNEGVLNWQLIFKTSKSLGFEIFHRAEFSHWIRHSGMMHDAL